MLSTLEFLKGILRPFITALIVSAVVAAFLRVAVFQDVEATVARTIIEFTLTTASFVVGYYFGQRTANGENGNGKPPVIPPSVF